MKLKTVLPSLQQAVIATAKKSCQLFNDTEPLHYFDLT